MTARRTASSFALTTSILIAAAGLLPAAAGAAPADPAAGPAADTTPRSSAPACDVPLGDGDDEADGALVVLVDGTLSSADQDERVDELVRTVDTTTDDRALDLTVGSFGGSDAEVRYASCLDGVRFVPDGNNARTRERNRPGLIDGLTDVLDGLAGGYESSDPTSAMRAGVERLAAAGDGPRLLLIHSDGIPTTGCAALPEQVNLDEAGLVDRLLDACTAAGRLPAADGVHVFIGGIGRTDADLSADAVTFLIDLNSALCEATGATCHVDPNLPPDLWPSDDETD